MLALPSGRIRGLRKLVDYLKELRRLSCKKAVGGEACDGGHRSSEFVVQRTNDRAVRKIRIYELTRDRKDQAGLNRRVEGAEEIFKRETAVRHRRDWGLYSVAGKIDPLQKVANLIPANAQCNFQHFKRSNFPGHNRIKAGTTLLDVSEVKGRGVGDHLNMSGAPVQIGV